MDTRDRVHPAATLAGAAQSCAAQSCAALVPLACAQASEPASAGAPGRAAAPLEEVTVTATRVEQRSFDVPASIEVVVLDPQAAQRPGVNLSEATGRVPGLVVRNRQNYAQDLQVSSRGFGARAAFGVRGVRLSQDGFPFTAPDGQGQTGLFELDSAVRIEVLKGPFAALYGNSAGGLVSLFTAEPPLQPTLRASAGAGSYGTWKAGIGFGTSVGAFGATGDLSRFETDGYREHSRARRDLLGAKLRWDAAEAGRFTLTATGLDQPDTQDPLALTGEQLESDRRQAGTGALAFDTRKSVRHRQAGLEWERKLGADHTLRLRGYAGEREVEQFLAFGGAAPGSSGGVVALERAFGGIGIQWTRIERLALGPFSFTLGVDYDRMGERRKGYVNEFGAAGALRRDQFDTVWSFDQYALAEWWFGQRWRLAGGVRHSSVGFRVEDDFVTASNPDDSGQRNYGATRPVVGLLYVLSDAVNLYASAGRGFETPTLAELSYRPDGQPGMNFGLEASTSSNLEVGMKAMLGTGGRLNLALFRTSTSNDIVPDANVGGRATFRNAARTARQGLELSLESTVGADFRAWLAYTLLGAEFREYRSLSGVDLSGNALPGVPRSSVYGELAWRHPSTGFSTAVEAQWSSRVWADDANTAGASGYSAFNWRLGYDWTLAGWRVTPYLRIDNLLDRRYVGSVVVNAANGRYYEPAPERTVFGGVKASHRF